MLWNLLKILRGSRWGFLKHLFWKLEWWLLFTCRGKKKEKKKNHYYAQVRKDLLTCITQKNPFKKEKKLYVRKKEKRRKTQKGLSKQKWHSETVPRDIEPFPLFLLPMEFRDSLSDEHLRSDSASGSRSWLSKCERARECEERECKCERGRRDGRVRCVLSIWIQRIRGAAATGVTICEWHQSRAIHIPDGTWTLHTHLTDWFQSAKCK